jgi:flagellar hook-associated protein 2
MAGIQLAGLASGFDWKSLVDKLMALENAPIDRLNRTKSLNSTRISALSDLGTKLTTLQTAVTDLRGPSTLFSNRLAVSTTASSTWSTTAAASTTTGNYTFAVSRLATAASLNGANDIGRGLNTTSDVSGLTLANLPTAGAATAGTLTVNGKQVTVALTDSLQNVFDAISTATGGTVTGSYDPTADAVTFASSSGPVMLGAANDTSNFFQVMKLANNGTTTTTSSGTLGVASTINPLSTARLRTAITAVDGSGNGSFTVNGVSIAYNVNTDSLSAVLSRINASTAGVTASYDNAADRVVLVNNTTGNIGASVNETSGGLMDALGLTAGSTFVAGQDAQFTVNGGATLTSKSNTFDASVHGITGLSVTANSATTQTIAVSGDTAGMKTKIQAFIDAFNAVQTFISDKTKITTSNGKVTTSVLTDNREVQSWASSLRSLAFGAVSGVTGSIQRLDNLGIDFVSGSSLLAIKDSTKLDAALANKGADVGAFFQTATTGLGSTLKTFLTSITTSNSSQQTNLTSANTGIDTSIADLQRRLDQRRALLEQTFIQMESAQSQLQSQSAALTNAFSQGSAK